MKTIPTKGQNEYGLHQRYKVEPYEGQPDPNAVYFVLRLDHQGNDREHVKACQLAALEFAKYTQNRKLAADLRQLVAFHTGMMAAREVAEDLTQLVKVVAVSDE